jgi:hypothetical protein
MFTFSTHSRPTRAAKAARTARAARTATAAVAAGALALVAACSEGVVQGGGNDDDGNGGGSPEVTLTLVTAAVDGAVDLGHEALHRRHRADHAALFDRCRLDLAQAAPALPTDELLAA